MICRIASSFARNEGLFEGVSAPAFEAAPMTKPSFFPSFSLSLSFCAMRVINVSCCCHGENKHLFCNGGGSVWGKSSSTPSRERKNLTRAERELVRRTENARTNTAAVSTNERTERDKKKKKKELLFERFKESFEFFERFSTAGRSRFPPQNRGVGHYR